MYPELIPRSRWHYLHAVVTLTILSAREWNPRCLLLWLHDRDENLRGKIMQIESVQDDRVAKSGRRLLWVAALVALVTAFAIEAQTPTVDGGPNWRMIGNNPGNSRNQPFERLIGPTNASRLALKWVATIAGDVSATPAVVDGAVYFGDFGGKLWKLDAETGAVVWSHSVFDYTGIAGDIVRTSPSVAGKTLVVGDLMHP